MMCLAYRTLFYVQYFSMAPPQILRNIFINLPYYYCVSLLLNNNSFRSLFPSRQRPTPPIALAPTDTVVACSIRYGVVWCFLRRTFLRRTVGAPR